MQPCTRKGHACPAPRARLPTPRQVAPVHPHVLAKPTTSPARQLLRRAQLPRDLLLPWPTKHASTPCCHSLVRQPTQLQLLLLCAPGTHFPAAHQPHQPHVTKVPSPIAAKDPHTCPTASSCTNPWLSLHTAPTRHSPCTRPTPTSHALACTPSGNTPQPMLPSPVSHVTSDYK